MISYLAGVITVVVLAYVYEKFGKRALATLLADINGLITELEEFKADTELKIADHLEEIAIHQSHVNVKGADVARATRIRDRLSELLQ